MSGSIPDGVTSATVADALIRLGLPVRLGPPGLRPLHDAYRVLGTARPAAHAGSVDVFLEAVERARAGDVLVVDNGGRLDEGCVGDLTALEARAAGLAGMVVWGLHRDTRELLEIGFPVWSLGRLPSGPRRLDARTPDALDVARVGSERVTGDDVVLADADGVVFFLAARRDEVVATAARIGLREREQASLVGKGTSLREQLRFREFLASRAKDPARTFRQHLRERGGAIEE